MSATRSIVGDAPIVPIRGRRSSRLSPDGQESGTRREAPWRSRHHAQSRGVVPVRAARDARVRHLADRYGGQGASRRWRAQRDAYAVLRGGELWLVGGHIPPYGNASRWNHSPDRDRKLLAHRRQIDKLAGQVQTKGLTIVPTRMYFNDDSRVKVEVALARGKDRFDKRQTKGARHEARHGARDARRAALNRRALALADPSPRAVARRSSGPRSHPGTPCAPVAGGRAGHRSTGASR